MKASVRNIISDGLLDYPFVSADGLMNADSEIELNDMRTDWISSWQSQVVLIVSQIVWTKKCDEALQSDNPYGGLKQYLNIVYA